MTVARLWLVHPVTALAVALLLINDHVLKAAYPGPVTGKLSDLAGLVVLPPLIALALALLPRLDDRTRAALALAATGLGFALVKAFAPAAAVASTVWSLVAGPSVIRADPTDLLTLPALGLAWWVWTQARRLAEHARPGTLRRVAERTAILVILPVATLAVAATSVSQYTDAIAVTARDGVLYIGIGDAYNEVRSVELWRSSTDGGQTWRDLDVTEASGVTALSMVEVTERLACLPADPRHCYRAVPEHLRVEETTDSGRTWSTSWEISGVEREMLARSYSEVGDARVYLASNALAVQSVPGGHVVVVANGQDGYARRDVDGDWERIGFGTLIYDGVPAEDTPLPLAPDSYRLLPEWVLAVLAGLIVAGLSAIRSLPRFGGQAVAATVVFVVGGLGVLLGLALWSVGDLMELVGGPIALFSLIVMLAGAVWALNLVSEGEAGGRRVALIGGISALTVMVCLCLVAGWAAELYPHRQGALAGLAVAVVGLILGVWLGGRARRSRA